MNQTFGNVYKDRLLDIVSKDQFSYLWNITKDEIEVCKDCEFRYICNDCRAFISDKSNIYSKPAKCKYDPYTTKWYE